MAKFIYLEKQISKDNKNHSLVNDVKAARPLVLFTFFLLLLLLLLLIKPKWCLTHGTNRKLKSMEFLVIYCGFYFFFFKHNLESFSLLRYVHSGMIHLFIFFFHLCCSSEKGEIHVWVLLLKSSITCQMNIASNSNDYDFVECHWFNIIFGLSFDLFTIAKWRTDHPHAKEKNK